MFEEQQQKPVEDIFDKVDKAAPAEPAPAPAPTAAMPGLGAPAATGGGMKMILITVGGIIGVAVLGTVGYLVYASFTANVPPTEQPAPAATETPSSTPTTEPAAPAPSVADFDTDKDGISDAEEIKLGTNPTKNDTDADGLFDNDEVNVYKTNPLKSDTDGDSYQDGEEVLSGYNPNGPGKLLDLDKAKAELPK